MTTDSQENFINDVMQEAHAAASHLGIPVSPVLAQWANETGFGTSQAWREGHNFAGVSGLTDQQRAIGAHLLHGGPILAYPNRADALAGYLARWSDGVYDSTREKWRTHHGDARAIAQAIEESPWAAGHYGGDGLRRLMAEHNLTRFDTGAISHPEPPPTVIPPCGALRPGEAPEGHHTLRVGARGDEVREVQLRLHDAGFPPPHSRRPDGSYDGIFGSGTAEAVAEFQSAHGLHRDGVVGRQTWCAFGIR